MQGSVLWPFEIMQFLSGFAAEGTDVPEVTQQFSGKFENGSQAPSSLSFLLLP